ncbi:MAG: choice-of-anchor S family protein [Candidatus Thorarchaeota archaeon]
MHKLNYLKLISAVIIVNLIFVTTPTKGSFGVEVGQQYKFKIIDAYTGGYYDYITSEFEGFTYSENIIPTAEYLTVMIESISASALVWNSTLNGIPEHGYCFLPVEMTPFLYSLLLGYSLLLEFNILSIQNSGEIDPYYLPPFIFPLFVDASPITWDTFDTMAENNESMFSSLASPFVDVSYDATKTETTEIYSMNWWFTGYTFQSLEPYAELSFYTNTTVSYDKSLGMLLASENIGQYNGTYDGDYYEFRLHHQVEQTDISDLMQFLEEYKWYFIGGGTGLVVLVLAVSIFIVVRKRREK